ncbi:MAG: tetratricopeptide repeat protein [Chlamydiota bacterium]
MRARRVLHGAALGALFLIAYAWFLPSKSPELFGTNNAVRFYLAKSLALDGSFAIERYYRGGIDAAEFNGHFYSGKAPAASFLAVPVIRMLSAACRGRCAAPDWVYLYVARLAVISIPSVVMILTLHGFLLRRGVPDRMADLIVAGYGLGTMAFPYSTEFVGHQLAAVFLFWCFLSLDAWRRVFAEYECEPAKRRNGEGATLKIRVAPVRRHAGSPFRRFGPLLMAGLCGGMAVAADYQTALIVAVLCLAMLPLRRPRSVVPFALGCIPGILLVLGYNYACFGNPLSFPYAHEAMPIAREVQAQGLFGVQAPRLVPFVKLLFSPWRGIFFGSPFLLLSLPGLCALWRDDAADADGAGGRRLAALGLCACGGYLLFNSSYGAWSGGAGYGPRFLVPVIPFFVIPVAALSVRGPKGGGILMAILVAYSVAFHFVATSAGPVAHEFLRNPVREFLLPSFLRGNVRPNWGAEAGWHGAAGLVPLIALLAACGILARLTGEGRARAEVRRVPGRVERVLLALCGVAAVAMAGLFVFHGTEETAYRHAVLGHSYDTAGDPDAAIPCFEKALAMDPRDPRVIDDLTRILVGRGEYRKALEANLRALASRPGDRGLQARVSALIRLCGVADALKKKGGDPQLLAEQAAALEILGILEPSRGEKGAR